MRTEPIRYELWLSIDLILHRDLCRKSELERQLVEEFREKSNRYEIMGSIAQAQNPPSAVYLPDIIPQNCHNGGFEKPKTISLRQVTNKEFVPLWPKVTRHWTLSVFPSAAVQSWAQASCCNHAHWRLGIPLPCPSGPHPGAPGPPAVR